MVFIPNGAEPAIIQAARAAALARAGGMFPGDGVNANVPMPIVNPPIPRVPNIIDDSGQVVQRGGKGALVDDSGQVVNSPGKAALGQMPQSIVPESYPETSLDEYEAEDPRTTPKGTSFFNKPGATDALTAFGAAMLKAPTFLQGLGDAALAVNAVEREQRMPTEAEILRSQMKYRIRNGTLGSGGTGSEEWVMGDTVVGDDGTQWTKVFNKSTGEMFYQNDSTGERIAASDGAGVPGATRIQNSGTGKDRDLDAAAIDLGVQAATQATTNIENFTEMRDLVDTAGVGTDLWTKLARNIASATGKDFSGVVIKDYTEFMKYASTIELDKALTQRGLGQFTENERMIVRRSLPNIDSNPEAAKDLLDVMIAREERIQEIWDEWEESGQPVGKFRAFVRKKMREYEAANGSIIDKTKGGGGGKKPPTSGIPEGVDPSYYN